MKLNYLEGNYNKLALGGGVISINVEWNCNLDWDIMEFCIPRYHFFLLDDSGYNFRYGKFHEENRRTLSKAYGLKFMLNVSGNGRMFDLNNTLIIFGVSLGTIGIANIFLDFIILRCSKDFRKQVLSKKIDDIKEGDNKVLIRKKSMIGMLSLAVTMPNQSEVARSNRMDKERLI